MTSTRRRVRAADLDRSTTAREPDTRYARVLETFQAAAHSGSVLPDGADPIAAASNSDRQLPEQRVQAMLEQVLCLAAGRSVAALIASGSAASSSPSTSGTTAFAPRGSQHRGTARRASSQQSIPMPRPTSDDIPNLLRSLGFAPDRADYLARSTSWSTRRAAPATRWARSRRGDKAHLRTRVGTRRHELQGLQHRRPRDGPQRRADVLAQRRRLHAAAGVPNTAFTEALAFVFQAPRPRAARPRQARRDRAQAMQALDDFWGDLRDRRRRAGRHARVALDVRASRTPPPASCAKPCWASRGTLEQLLRAGLRVARRDAARASTRT